MNAYAKKAPLFLWAYVHMLLLGNEYWSLKGFVVHYIWEQLILDSIKGLGTGILWLIKKVVMVGIGLTLTASGYGGYVGFINPAQELPVAGVELPKGPDIAERIQGSIDEAVGKVEAIGEAVSSGVGTLTEIAGSMEEITAMLGAMQEIGAEELIDNVNGFLEENREWIKVQQAKWR